MSISSHRLRQVGLLVLRGILALSGVFADWFSLHQAFATSTVMIDGASTSQTVDAFGAADAWMLNWNFANGQTITQFWNGSYTQSASNVSVSNASYNGTIRSRN